MARRLFAFFIVAGPILIAATAGAQNPQTPGSVFQECDSCPKMVVIPAGSNVMGSAPEETDRESVPIIEKMDIASFERPRHTVSIATPFAIGRTEVTRSQFSAFIDETNYRLSPGCRGNNEGTVGFVANWSWRDPGYEQGPDHPVMCVSWADAQAYTQWLSSKTGATYRLPSETEWEYAARGGTATARYWGDDREQACEYENVSDQALRKAEPDRVALGSPPFEFPCDDGYAYTAPVASFKANPYGLYDMIGNAREWVWDCFDVDYSRKPRDGKPMLELEPCARASKAILDRSDVLYVVKAASYRYAPYGARVARRGSIPKWYHSNNVGFRVARELP